MQRSSGGSEVIRCYITCANDYSDSYFPTAWDTPIGMQDGVPSKAARDTRAERGQVVGKRGARESDSRGSSNPETPPGRDLNRDRVGPHHIVRHEGHRFRMIRGS